ncbi:MAG: hypothetical protein HZA90_04980 [Verrucomicrobia bacterium]|nr:hypothetical protein [Verrucomicrobiota bacterium]
MSTVQEIEAALPRLSRQELEALRAWLDEFLENQLAASLRASADEAAKPLPAWPEGYFETIAGALAPDDSAGPSPLPNEKLDWREFMDKPRRQVVSAADEVRRAGR